MYTWGYQNNPISVLQLQFLLEWGRNMRQKCKPALTTGIPKGYPDLISHEWRRWNGFALPSKFNRKLYTLSTSDDTVLPPCSYRNQIKKMDKQELFLVNILRGVLYGEPARRRSFLWSERKKINVLVKLQIFSSERTCFFCTKSIFLMQSNYFRWKIEVNLGGGKKKLLCNLMSCSAVPFLITLHHMHTLTWLLLL